jgi:hypothetical protein
VPAVAFSSTLKVPGITIGGFGTRVTLTMAVASLKSGGLPLSVARIRITYDACVL